MIALHAPTYDLNGVVTLIDAHPSNPYEARRRGTVTATLDGGVSVYDTGLSVADQTLKVEIRKPTKDLLVQLRYLIAYYPLLRLCCEIGAYDTRAEFSLTGDVINLQLRLISRLDA